MSPLNEYAELSVSQLIEEAEEYVDEHSSGADLIEALVYHLRQAQY